MRTAAGIALIAATLAWSPLQAQEACAPDRLDVRANGASARFAVEVADDAEERAQGLMNRPEMPRFAGMLFVYEAPGPVAFWMKNTMIPLDMLFADETGTVRRIHRNAEPYSTDSIPGGDDIRFVLEINGGMSDLLGLTEGAQLRHPAIPDETAAWPCGDGAS
ncbi:DUF192 domain-containing protein [Rhodobacteraceae bacterium 2CG4]|uniref:DUF192 domain-containing protein n=1 Tax=Halovulum marinum TaxID=2662447 RepID=A0A6L5Z342_9RHOB|nr:DUF192 domain-containing protein [Halovulum marinum]MSU90947.1 DUF192 domain-containing protein [Halovulum marinum]